VGGPSRIYDHVGFAREDEAYESDVRESTPLFRYCERKKKSSTTLKRPEASNEDNSQSRSQCPILER
jgi:hypothetical protein